MQAPPHKSSIIALEIVVISPVEVIVDGTNCGNLCDAMANMPQFAAKFQQALEKAWTNNFDLRNLDLLKNEAISENQI